MAIIQARMGSSRFPGKMLARLGEFPVLEWVVRRVKRASKLDEIVLATTNQKIDDVLVNLGAQHDVCVFRGSETDVLGRFVDAARMAEAENIVRICADNPFIDPCEIDRLVQYFNDNFLDYACNHQHRDGSNYADGFGAEIVSAALLKSIGAKVNKRLYREHVTLYLLDHSNEYKLGVVQAPAGLAHPNLCFDIDTLEDLNRLELLVRAGVHIDTPARAIVRLALCTHFDRL